MDCTPILTIIRDLSDVLAPIKKTSLKYQCIATSNEYICLGATTGSTYVFDRNTGKLLRFFSHKVNAIVALKFSFDEKLLAVADSSGTISCWEVDTINKEFKNIKEINDFNGTLVTSMCWNEASSRLMVGNQNGLVMTFNVGFAAFYKSETIRKSGKPIVQMDFCQDRLVISSTTNAMLCYTERSQFHQIGTKPRDGLYGACFIRSKNENPPVIYSARPGSRLWEVDMAGQVLATHQFKESLNVIPTPIIASRDISLAESNISWNQPQSFNFPLLIPVMDQYLLTWSPRGIYLINPCIGSIALWNDQITEISDICCTKNQIYILHFNGSVTEVSLLTTKQCLLELRRLEEWIQLAKISCAREDEILKNVELFLSIGFDDILLNIKDQVKPEDSVIIEEFVSFIRNIEARHTEIRTVVQERMNQMLLNNSDPVNTSDSGMEDSDDVRSTASEGMSETSSMISLSRLAEVKDNLMQKATNAMVSKVFKSGFMKKAFREALESEGVILDPNSQRPKSPIPYSKTDVHKTHSVPTSPIRSRSVSSLQRCASDQLLKKDIATSVDPREKYLYRKTISSPSLPTDTIQQQFPTNVKIPANINVSRANNEDLLVQRGGRKKNTRRKKKAKVIKLESTDEVSGYVPDTIKDSKKTLQNVNNFVQVETSGDQTEVNESPPQPLPLISTVASVDHLIVAVEQQENNNVIDGVVSTNDRLILKPPANTSLIVNKLISTTFATRNDFRDAVILYNPVAFIDKLKRWSCCLATVAAEFREECFRTLEFSVQQEMSNIILAYLDVECNALFFNQYHSAYSEVCNVAMLCFETNTFPEKCYTMKGHEISLLNAEITLKYIVQRAFDSISNIRTLHATTKINKDDIKENEALEVESSEDIKIKGGDVSGRIEVSVVEGEYKSTSVFPSISENREPTFQPENMETLQTRDVKDLLFDRRSLSTIASETETIIGSDNDVILESVDILVENHTLCENFKLEEGESCEQCLVDKCRACFVLRYFPILNFARIRSLLSWSGKCRWRTWLACVIHLIYSRGICKLSKLLEDDTTTDISIIDEVKQSDIKVLLGYSTELYNKSTRLLLECTSMKDLMPWEVTLLYYTGILGNNKNNQENYDGFLNYANNFITDAKLDPVFLQCVLKSVFGSQPNKELLFCSCGKAKPGSNSVTWKWNSLLQKLVGNIFTNSTLPKDEAMLRKFSEFCKSYGYWYGHLHLVSKCNTDSKNVLRLLCQLLDYELLTKFIAESCINLSEDDWTSLLQDFTTIPSNGHVCYPLEGWSPTLTLEKIIKLIAVHCGTRYALHCLKDIKVDNMSQLHGVYTSLLRAAELESKQDSIVSKLIEIASAKVWSETASVIPHEVIKNAELQGNESTVPSGHITSDYIQDESDAVWGRNINISSAECPVCTLPLCLKSTYTNASTGLIVFQCGHSFHKICVPENACLVCYHDNFSLHCSELNL